MVIEIIGNGIITFIDTYLLYLFVGLFSQKRNINKFMRVLPFILILLLNFVCSVFVLTDIRILLHFLLRILFCFIQFNDKWYKYLINTGLFFIILIIVEALTLSILNIFTEINATQVSANYDSSIFLIIILMRLIIFITILILRNFIGKPIRQIKWQVFLLMPILTIAFIWLIYNRYLGIGNPEVDRLLTYVSVFLVVQNVFVFFYVISLQNSTKRYNEIKAAYERQKQYSETIATIQQSIRKMAHDIRHHFIYLMSAMDQEDIPKAKSYLTELDANLDNMIPLNVTGHCDIDALLHAKVRLAEQQGVNIKVQGVLPPEIIISPIDLSALLGNSLENAIEAASKVTGEKEVTITFGYNEPRLNYSISNPYTGQLRKKPDGYFLSQKFNGGLGLEIMDEVVKKYGGTLLPEYDEEQFTLTVMLQLRDSIHKEDL